MSFSRVAQPHLALGAVPRGVNTLFAPTVAPTTSCPLVLCLLVGIFLGDGHRKVTERERTTTSEPQPALRRLQ